MAARFSLSSDHSITTSKPIPPCWKDMQGEGSEAISEIPQGVIPVRPPLFSLLLLVLLPQLVLAAPAQPPDQPISPETIRNLFLVFAAVVLLFIGLKWVYIWRRMNNIGNEPRPEPPPTEPGDPTEPPKPQG